MNVAGVIFSNLHDKNIPQLTKRRTTASIPFLCRYRLIDFALSNMVNSGITNIDVITHYNYHSLMDHIGTGKNWDLARLTGGIKILPPYITAYANSASSLYSTRLEALKSVVYSIMSIKEDYVVLMDCDVICNIDVNDLLREHFESGADITMAVQRMELTEEMASKNVLIESDDEGNIKDIMTYPGKISGARDVSLNIWVINRGLLQSILNDAIAHDYSNLNRDIIFRNIGVYNMRVYRYEGYSAVITSLDEYYLKSMELIERTDYRRELFEVEDRPIFTKVRNSAPTKYTAGAKVINSLIGDGCIIEGKVENSILFRGVRVGKGTHIKNSILFQDTVTGDDVTLECVVSDKDVIIRDGRMIKGYATMPIHIEKGKMI